jgi:uncharacterized membrane protein
MSTAAKGSTGKLVFFIVFGLLTAFVLIAKNGPVFDPSSEIARHFAPAKGYLIVHAFFGILALTLGAFQFSNRLRARYLKLHRSLGYVYVLGVFLAAPFAIPVALRTSNMSLVAATSVQSFGWVACTAIALYCVKNGNIEQHRRWMMRGYPFAMVFTVARLIIPIPPIMKLGLPGIELVVWVTISAAAILPSIFLDWTAIQKRPAQA